MPDDLSRTARRSTSTPVPLRFRVHEDDIIDITAAGDRQEFTITFQSTALREFLDVGAEARARVTRESNGERGLREGR